jgi:hypothetical protein
MIVPKKKPRGLKIERLLILVTSLGLAVYLIVRGTQEGKIDYIYVIGLLFVVIGYFAKEITGQDDDEEPQ